MCIFNHLSTNWKIIITSFLTMTYGYVDSDQKKYGYVDLLENEYVVRKAKF